MQTAGDPALAVALLKKQKKTADDLAKVILIEFSRVHVLGYLYTCVHTCIHAWRNTYPGVCDNLDPIHYHIHS